MLIRRRPPTPTTQLLPEGPVTLDASYALCREFNKRHGTTYYWSTKVLPRVKQHHVHALYAFARYADDIVDEIPSQGGRDVPTEVRAAALADFGEQFFADLERGRSDDPVLKAVVHTVRAFDIAPSAFERFLRSMTMDLTVASYQTWDDLLDYMDGSAAVIGEMMLPILEPGDLEAARPHARDLGNAFQLTNFLRDIDEDLDRGRQLGRFGDKAAVEGERHDVVGHIIRAIELVPAGIIDGARDQDLALLGTARGATLAERFNAVRGPADRDIERAQINIIGNGGLGGRFGLGGFRRCGRGRLGLGFGGRCRRLWRRRSLLHGITGTQRQGRDGQDNEPVHDIPHFDLRLNHHGFTRLSRRFRPVSGAKLPRRASKSPGTGICVGKG